MRRDFGNEMLAAGTIIVVLMAAMTFGVLLSSMADDGESTITATPVLVGDAPTAEATPTPHKTATHTEHATTADAPTVTQTPTDAPSATITPTHTQAVPTVAASTTTRTPSATVTIPPTNTPPPPIRTVRGPAVTIPPRPSITPAPPRSTSPPDFDLGIVSTPSPVFTATPTACTPPAGWLAYEVESGVTLFMIALQVGRPVAVLQDANCLRNADRIDAGQVIYVPRLPAGLDVRREVQGCNNPDITITSPRPNQRFSRSFDVIGTVDPPLFGYFNLEIRADEADGYNFLSRSDDVVRDGLLGRIDTSLFTDGRYWVRVVMVDATGNVPANASCAIPITLD